MGSEARAFGYEQGQYPCQSRAKLRVSGLGSGVQDRVLEQGTYDMRHVGGQLTFTSANTWYDAVYQLIVECDRVVIRYREPIDMTRMGGEPSVAEYELTAGESVQVRDHVVMLLEPLSRVSTVVPISPFRA